MYRIGIDLGGTNIAVGVVDDNFNIIGRGKMKLGNDQNVHGRHRRDIAERINRFIFIDLGRGNFPCNDFTE